MVDAQRVDRLLARVDDDLRSLRQYRHLGDALLGDALLADPTALAATKYYLITAVEGCLRVAQHLAASEG